MKRIFKPCELCKGAGVYPAIASNNTSTYKPGDFLGYNVPCEMCQGSGVSDEVAYFIDD